MTTEKLAKLVLSLLDLQADYFRTRSTSKLAECRDAERRMRETCLEVLNPSQPTLFDSQPAPEANP